MAKRKMKRFYEGGISEDEDKAAGLEASKEDKVGFLERLRMGNIDDSTSEAYKRFGAGRGRAARVPVEDRVGTPVEEIRAQDKPAPAASSSPATISDAMMAKGRDEGMPKGSGDASVAEAYSGPRTKPIETSSAAQASMPSTSAPAARSSAGVRSSSSASSGPSGKAKAAASDAASMFRASERASRGAPSSASAASSAKPSASTPRKSAVDMIPTDGYRKVEGGERIDSSELGRNVNNALNAVVPGPARAVNAAKGAAKAGSRALREVDKAETPVTYLGKSGRRQVSGFDELSGTGGRPALGSSPLSLRGTSDTKALAAPTRQLGYDKAGAVAKRRSERSAARDAEMQAENTAATSRAASRQKTEELANELRKGQAKTKFTSKSKGQLKRTKKFDDSEAGIEFKRGGSVNPASKRADGIATRGKTRCKIC